MKHKTILRKRTGLRFTAKYCMMLLLIASLPFASRAQSGCSCSNFSLINPDFEQPGVALNTFAFINQNSVPGWSTNEFNGDIEIWGSGWGGVTSYSGNNFAELNAHTSSALFQNVNTCPGQVYSWQVAHRARVGTDVARFEAGPPGGPYTTIQVMTDGTSAWGFYQGTYTVPAGQTVTEIRLTAVSAGSGNNSVGNFIDKFFFAPTFCIDDDLDGYTENQGDCNDADNTIYPGAPELCDNKDNDCDTFIDEGYVATITVNAPTTTVCTLSNLTLTANAGVSYQWKLNGNNINGATSQSYMPTQSGNYSVEVNGGGLCLATSASIPVTINTPPTFINCPGNILANNMPGQCKAGIIYNSLVVPAGTPAPTLNYNMTGATVASGTGNGSGTQFNVGVTNVAVTATNSCGTTTCNFTVTVRDAQAPNAICQNATLQLDNNGSATVTPAQINNGSTDNCGVASVLFQDVNTTTNLVVNGSFNTGTTGWGMQNIDGLGGWRNAGGNPGGYFILNDGGFPPTDPTIFQTINGLVPGQVYQLKGFYRNHYGCCGAFIGQPALAINVNAASTILPNPGMNWTPFVFTFEASSTSAQLRFRAEINGTDTDMDIDEISLHPVTTSNSISYNCTNTGANTVTLLVKDVNGNFGTCNAAVEVQDVTAPTITCPADATVSCQTSPDDNGEATGTDNCGAVTIMHTDASTQDPNPANSGHYSYTITRTWKATDASGNFTTCNQVITVSELNGATITINPVNTINSNHPDHTIFLGYGPQSVTLTASVQGGVGTYSYNWSPTTGVANPISASTSVSPTTTTTYTVTITDGTGCTLTQSFTVNVVDVRCGNGKIKICHYPPGNPANYQQKCLPVSAIADHLSHGDILGDCPQSKNGNSTDEEHNDHIGGLVVNEMKVYPNPNNGAFTVELPAGMENANVVIMDMAGKVIQKQGAMLGSKLQFDLGDVASGVYMLHVTSGTQTYRSKISVQ